MAFIEMENPRRKTKRRKRRNATATSIRGKAKNPVTPIKRRNISVATAKNVLKKNGLKAVSKSAANPRKRRGRRRNGLTPVITRRQNGIFGNTKKDVKEVASLLVGLFGAKGIGRFLIPYAQPYMAQMGAGKYTEILIDAIVGIGVLPMVAQKFARSFVSQVRLGGLAAVGIDAIELVAPDTFNALNPFNSNPIVLTSQGAAIPVGTVAQAAAEIANSANPAMEAAKLAGALRSSPINTMAQTSRMPIGSSQWAGSNF